MSNEFIRIFVCEYSEKTNIFLSFCKASTIFSEQTTSADWYVKGFKNGGYC